ncbi:SDR family oxidoreductase [Romeria aff. gracilis LEGE 07310]|uniref:SDR family oxidoreductase n=1 Tax=Vasconcelosia minhoensis LEGE 07310 TaxID=915328 RepID=A0A8J7DMY4_9CYAN|nr:SDR family oxidoreductase [Romeria gracilis]MBE9079551.1 SDR family oxidoreductase [Romeria aff. gracilis LEGE 07310]
MATYVVTGANRGIGYEYCRQLTERGDRAIAVCRSISEPLQQLGIQVEDGVDITAEKDVSALAHRLAGTPIDGLINNAGILERVSLDDLDFDSMRQQFEVNALGMLRMTQALLPLMHDGSKVAIMTSRMGSIGDNTSGGSYGYRMSKAATSMAGKSLAHDLKPRGIAVAILHPGLVSTRMTGHTDSGISPEAAVKNLLQRIDQLTLENTGTFWHANGEELPW